MPRSIAIDGPVGAGKSTIAKALAEALGMLYLDTGATYRALALQAIREGVSPLDAQKVAKLLAQTTVSVELLDGEQHTFLGGEDVTCLLRTPEVSAAASAISMHAAVREKMVALQRRSAAKVDIVLDGRDIGTRVLPHATYKFFLNALPEERAKRRFVELQEKGITCTYQQVLDELMARDKQDSERLVDPLRPAVDAIVIDTTNLGKQEVLRKLISIIQENGNER